jgi:hypothetical protein
VLVGWLVLYAVFVSACKNEPPVTACVVDAPNRGFQCSENGTKDLFVPLEQGQILKCLSPWDTEYFLKACKRGEIVEQTECSYVEDLDRFQCVDVLGKIYFLDIMEADNYFCLSPKDKRRVREKCKRG